MKGKQLIVFIILWSSFIFGAFTSMLMHRYNMKEKYKQYYKYDLKYDSLNNVYNNFTDKYLKSKTFDSMLIYKDSCLNILNKQGILLDSMNVELIKIK